MNTNNLSKKASIALLISRIIFGSIFIAMGWMKVSNINLTVDMFGSMGLIPAIAFLVSYGELFLGFLLLIGLWTRFVAPLLAIIMIGAVWLSIPLGFSMYVMPLAILIALGFHIKHGAGTYRIKSSMCN